MHDQTQLLLPIGAVSLSHIQKWDSTQERLRRLVITEDDFGCSVEDVKLIGGVDISCVELPAGDPAKAPVEWAVAALVVVALPDLRVVYEDYIEEPMAVPYVPGYLAFRECPLYTRLLQRVACTPWAPQVVLVDGCGVLHPKRCGCACQVGITAGCPSVGVAKTLLAVDGLSRDQVRGLFEAQDAGHIDGAGQQQRASHVAGPSAISTASPGLAPLGTGGVRCSAVVRMMPLVGSSGQQWGVAIRRGGPTKQALYVSAGHRVCLETAVDLVLRCCIHRIPEPIRQADLRSRERIRRRLAAAAQDSITNRP